MRRLTALLFTVAVLIACAIPTFAMDLQEHGAEASGSIVKALSEYLQTLSPDEREQFLQKIDTHKETIQDGIEEELPFLMFAEEDMDTGLTGLLIDTQTGESISLDEVTRICEAMKRGEAVEVPALFYEALITQVSLDMFLQWTTIAVGSISSENTDSAAYDASLDNLLRSHGFDAETPEEWIAQYHYIAAAQGLSDQELLTLIETTFNEIEQSFRAANGNGTSRYVYVIPNPPDPIHNSPARAVAGISAASALGISLFLNRRRDGLTPSILETAAEKIATRNGAPYTLLLNEGLELDTATLDKDVTILIPIRVEQGEALQWSFTASYLLSRQRKAEKLFPVPTASNTAFIAIHLNGDEITKHQWLYCTVTAFAIENGKPIVQTDVIDLELQRAQPPTTLV